MMKYEMKQHLFCCLYVGHCEKRSGYILKNSHFAFLRKQHTGLEGHKVNK